VSASIESLLSMAHRQGIRLWLKDGQLRYRLPKGDSALSVFAEVRQRKDEALTFLRARQEAPMCIPELQPQVRPLQLALSFAQQRLWIVEQLGVLRGAQNMGSSLRVRGELDLHAFERSLQEIVRRHESLRTRIETSGGEGWQVIEPPGAFHVDLRDLSALEDSARACEMRRIVQAERDRAFVLTQASLFRVVVLKLAAREHVLSFVIHHIISDNASLEVLVKELITLYAAYREGRPSPLEDLTVQYADFAQWQRGWLQGETLDRLLAYWKEHLAGMAPALELPPDRPRPAVATFMRAACAPIELPRSLAAVLAELGRRQAASLYMVLLTAFQILLARLSGQNDVAVGSPISGRTHRQTENLIGCFVNTLVMRTDLSADPSFAELLDRVRQNALAAYVHQDMPFEKLVAELHPPRDLSRQPLVQVMFTLDNHPERRVLDIPGLLVEEVSASLGAARFDLLLTLEENEGGIRGSFEYPADSFEVSTIERYVHWFTRILEQAAADPRRPLSRMRLLDQDERESVLIRWNRTSQERSRTSVTELIDRCAEARPRSIALVCSDGQMSYGELQARSDKVARYLCEAGVGPDVVVGVYLDRSVEQVISLLAILKAGGTYLPLEVTYPSERLSYMLADARVGLVLTHERLRQSLAHHATRVLCLDKLELRMPPDGTLGVAVHPEQLACVIYISGPAGHPDGVGITQENLRQRATALETIAPYGTDAVCCYKSPIGSADALYEVLEPLSQGAQLVVVSEPAGRSARELLEEIELRGVSRWTTSPSLAAALMQSDEVDPDSDRLRLRHWMLSGETLDVQLLQWLARELPECRFINLYGGTEASSGCIAYVANGHEPYTVPVGKPLANVQVYVLDTHLEPVPVGMAGELYIGGAGLARGYLNEPRQTAQRFVANPYGPPGGRMYRTGDRVRYTANAELEYLGRRDQRVKLRGHRIELEEIESSLRSHGGVQDAAVLLHKPGTAEAQLVAYYVVAAGENVPDVAALKAHLREKLPEFMVPDHFAELERLPLTASGKLDRRALPQPARALQPAKYLAPRTPTEQTLAQIWAGVLKVERIGVHDNFFELGGDSIVSIQIVERAGSAGLHLNLRQMFEHQTIAEVALVARIAATVEADLGPVEGSMPLSPIQHYFFELQLQEPNHFNQSRLFVCHETISVPLLRRAFGFLTAHHDALRLRFSNVAGQWVQEYAPAEPENAITVAELPDSDDALQAAALRRAADEAQRSLNITTGPMLRVILFNRGLGRTQRLGIIVHHLAVDTVSWRILLEDLETVYRQLAADESVRLPPKTTSFKRWAELLQQHAHSADLEKERPYWESLTSAGVCALPVDFSNTSNVPAQQGCLSAGLDAEETRRLLFEVPGIYRTQINDVLLTALADAFGGWTSERRLLVSLEGHGREDLFDDVSTVRTVGWFTSVFPVCLDIAAATDPGHALRRVKEQLRAIPGYGVGYGILRYSSEKPIFPNIEPQVSFNYHGKIDGAATEGSLFSAAKEDHGQTISPLNRRPELIDVNAAVVDGMLEVQWGYSSAVHRRTTIESLANAYVVSLRRLIENCLRSEAAYTRGTI